MELINQIESECSKAQTNAITTSTNGIKTLAIQLIEFSELSNTLTIEVQRLQELLRKNNIQFTLPSPEPVKLSENVAVIQKPEKLEPTSQS